MKKRTSSTALTGLVLMACIFAASQSAGSAMGEASAAGHVKVTVEYTGKGDVDADHRLWIWLFDTPNIGPGAIPVAERSLDQNGGSATFTDVGEKNVYVAVAYDQKGGFGGSAPPPSGSPVALYGMESGAPTAVVAEETTAISVKFDDSQRMP